MGLLAELRLSRRGVLSLERWCAVGMDCHLGGNMESPRRRNSGHVCEGISREA